MNRKHLLFWAVVGVGALGLLAVSWADVPDQVTIEKCGTKRAPVTFDHAAHVKLEGDCTTCHHTDEGLTADSGTPPKSCHECHFEPKEDVPSCSEMSPSKNPFHKLCISCHKTAAQENESVNAPTKCDGCHPKE